MCSIILYYGEKNTNIYVDTYRGWLLNESCSNLRCDCKKNLSIRVGVQCISAYIKASDGNVDLYQVLEIIIE